MTVTARPNSPALLKVNKIEMVISAEAIRYKGFLKSRYIAKVNGSTNIRRAAKPFTLPIRLPDLKKVETSSPIIFFSRSRLV